MTARQLAKAVLPPIVVATARWLVGERRPPQPETPPSTHYERVDAWPMIPARVGHVAFGVGTRAELDVPVVRDNLEALSQISIPRATLLDFGCGNGHYRFILSACPHTATWDYVGTDKVAALVQFCRATYPGTRFELASEGEPLPFPDETFDVVFASGVLQYCEHPSATLGELCRVSRAYVLVSRLPTWKYQNSQIIVQTVRGPWGEDQYPLHVFHRGTVEDLLPQGGLSVVVRDVGSEFVFISGEGQPAVHMTYLLRKTGRGDG